MELGTANMERGDSPSRQESAGTEAETWRAGGGWKAEGLAGEAARPEGPRPRLKTHGGVCRYRAEAQVEARLWKALQCILNLRRSQSVLSNAVYKDVHFCNWSIMYNIVLVSVMQQWCSFINVYVCVCATQSCPTLCDPMDYTPTGSSVHGILQARILAWLAIPFSRGSSQPRGWTQVLHCRRILYHLNHQGSSIQEVQLLLILHTAVCVYNSEILIYPSSTSLPLWEP